MLDLCFLIEPQQMQNMIPNSWCQIYLTSPTLVRYGNCSSTLTAYLFFLLLLFVHEGSQGFLDPIWDNPCIVDV